MHPATIQLSEKHTEVFTRLAQASGLTLSQYINALLDEVSQQEELNDETVETLEKSERGEDVYGPFDSFEEMMASINA